MHIEKKNGCKSFLNLEEIVVCIRNVEYKILKIREDMLNSDDNIDVENAHLILHNIYALIADVAYKSYC